MYSSKAFVDVALYSDIGMQFHYRYILLVSLFFLSSLFISFLACVHNAQCNCTLCKLFFSSVTWLKCVSTRAVCLLFMLSFRKKNKKEHRIGILALFHSITTTTTTTTTTTHRWIAHIKWFFFNSCHFFGNAARSSNITTLEFILQKYT